MKNYICLTLWNGHKFPGNKDHWGESGPTFFVYKPMIDCSSIRFIDIMGKESCLRIIENTIYYDSVYYDEWSFMSFRDLEENPSTFIQEKARPILTDTCLKTEE